MKKTLPILFIAMAAIFGFSHRAHAIVPLPFGGLVVFELPCTCEGGAYEWYAFAPLYLGNSAPTIGALLAPVTPLAFPWYYLKLGSWALGWYEPGVTSASCQIGVEPYCYPLPNEGMITPDTGVSASTSI